MNISRHFVNIIIIRSFKQFHGKKWFTVKFKDFRSGLLGASVETVDEDRYAFRLKKLQ